MRLFLWIVVGVLALFFLAGVLTLLSSRDIRNTRQGRDILVAELAVAIILVALIHHLVGRMG